MIPMEFNWHFPSSFAPASAGYLSVTGHWIRRLFVEAQSPVCRSFLCAKAWPKAASAGLAVKGDSEIAFHLATDMQKQTKKYPKERPGTCQRKIIYTRSRTGLTRRVIAWGLELGHWSRKRTFLMSRCRSKHAEAGGSRSVTPHESLGTSQSLTRSANATSIEESSSVEGHVYQFALETVDLCCTQEYMVSLAFSRRLGAATHALLYLSKRRVNQSIGCLPLPFDLFVTTMSTPHAIELSYDIVFAGGGTAALIVATRLATAFPDLKIAVFESGPDVKGKFEHTTPGLYISHLAPTSKTMQFYFSKPSPGTGNRDLVVPSGMCVGGGSSVNFMLYNRCSASDYDDWETKYGNKGWGSKNLIPLLQKAETYDIEPTKVSHGDSGPLHVTYGGDVFDIGKQYIDIGSKFEKDRPQSDEGSDFTAESINKFFQTPKWITKDGIRSDVAHHYYYNVEFKNLVVFDGVRVNRILVTNGTATGVEYLFDKRVHEGASQDLKVVSATKLVVVSAGAMGSPLILERSGIGRKDILNKFNIPVVQELPGVGENYQDHPAVFTPYYADPETATMDAIFRGDADFVAKVIPQYQKDRTGWLATNGIDAICKMRPHPDEVAQLGPEFKKYWDEVLKAYPDKPLFILMATGGSPGDASAEPTKKFICHNTFLSYAASRGYLHISSTDVYANPDFDCGYFTDPADIAAVRWGYKKAREIFRRLPIYRGPRLAAHPQFPAGSPAAWDPEEKGPVAFDAPVFRYTKEDDKAIDKFSRDVVVSSWHSLGTCAMKPRDQHGVVDSSLNVYGIKNLKVADLSIPPSIVHSNTYATAIAVGEKAATIIAEELGGKV